MRIAINQYVEMMNNITNDHIMSINKKSRIYGTSDRSDLSIYPLSGADALGSRCSRERMRERIREGIPEPLIG